jgi:ribosomal protein S6--L-glutamate ligase
MAPSSRIGFLVEARYMAQSQPAGLIDALRARGRDVAVIDPRASGYTLGDDAWLDGLGGLVARGRSWDLLCLLEWAEAAGLPTINTKAAVAGVFNKADMSVTIAANGLPAPRTWFGTIERLAEAIPVDAYPVILKLIFGDNCRGLVVADDRDALVATDWPEPVAIAQSYHRTDGFDLKLYGIGGDVWGVRKPSPFNAAREGATGDAEAVDLDDELVLLGRRCGEIFGLDLFGVDCIVAEGRPLVIEVNDYPNFTAVPNANERMADFVEMRIDEGGAA